MEDRELVQRLLAKDPQAQNYFYETYRPKLYRICAYILGYQDRDAEDMVQETFIRALQKLSGFEFRSSLGRWVAQICVHLCYRQLRRRKRMVLQADEDMEQLLAFSDMERQGREQLERETRKMVELVEGQKSLLGKPCQELLELRDNSKKSYIELAEILRVPMGTVMSRLARCKEALKELVRKALPKGSL